MALDPQYITGFSLEEYFVSKSDGTPLSGGYVEFYRDDSRATAKAVYQLVQGSGTPPNYTYSALPNPLYLSGVGTIQNSGGDNVALYYFPYDENGALQLYYVKVYDQYGNLQFTREGWPNVSGTAVPPGNVNSGTTGNEISNGQFVDVLFEAPTLTVSYTAGTTDVTIAPDWVLSIVASNSGSLTVTQTPINGSSAYPNNPPYTLDITPGSNITGLSLVQRFSNNPDIGAPATGAAANGFIASSILLGTGTSVTIAYAPSIGSSQIILTANNTSGAYAQFNETNQLSPAANTDTSVVGYVDFIIVLSTSAPSSISNIQAVFVPSNSTNFGYIPDTVNRQKDYLFHYYNDLLQYKPIPSYLIGWDFPLNPAQALGSSVAAQAVGANKSYYAWDQTIVFQSADSGVTISRHASGALKTLSAPVAGTQLALVQYVPGAQAIEMLTRRKCVNVSANASVATVATVSLWYTTGALPSTIGSNNSIVATLDSRGYPATQNGTWVKVGRSGLANNTVTSASTNAAQITIGTNSTTEFNQYAISGWDMDGAADITNATFFAIVVGTASLAQNEYVLWQSISCQDGDIPTIPAPKSKIETLQDCQAYYEKSFNLSVVPAQNVGTGNGEYATAYPSFVNVLTPYVISTIPYKVSKYATPTTVTLYNPSAANAEIRNIVNSSDSTGAAAAYSGQNGFGLSFTGGLTGTQPGDTVIVNWTADARLGQ